MNVATVAIIQVAAVAVTNVADDDDVWFVLFLAGVPWTNTLGIVPQEASSMVLLVVRSG